MNVDIPRPAPSEATAPPVAPRKKLADVVDLPAQPVPAATEVIDTSQMAKVVIEASVAEASQPDGEAGIEILGVEPLVQNPVLSNRVDSLVRDEIQGEIDRLQRRRNRIAGLTEAQMNQRGGEGLRAKWERWRKKDALSLTVAEANQRVTAAEGQLRDANTARAMFLQEHPAVEGQRQQLRNWERQRTAVLQEIDAVAGDNVPRTLVNKLREIDDHRPQLNPEELANIQTLDNHNTTINQRSIALEGDLERKAPKGETEDQRNIRLGARGRLRFTQQRLERWNRRQTRIQNEYSPQEQALQEAQDRLRNVHLLVQRYQVDYVGTIGQKEQGIYSLRGEIAREQASLIRYQSELAKTTDKKKRAGLEASIATAQNLIAQDTGTTNTLRDEITIGQTASRVVDVNLADRTAEGQVTSFKSIVRLLAADAPIDIENLTLEQQAQIRIAAVLLGDPALAKHQEVFPIIRQTQRVGVSSEPPTPPAGGKPPGKPAESPPTGPPAIPVISETGSTSPAEQIIPEVQALRTRARIELTPILGNPVGQTIDQLVERLYVERGWDRRQDAQNREFVQAYFDDVNATRPVPAQTETPASAGGEKPYEDPPITPEMKTHVSRLIARELEGNIALMNDETVASSVRAKLAKELGWSEETLIESQKQLLKQYEEAKQNDASVINRVNRGLRASLLIAAMLSGNAQQALAIGAEIEEK